MSSNKIARLVLLLALAPKAFADRTGEVEAPATQTPATCEITLVGPVGIDVPVPLDPAVRIPQISAHVLEILRRDAGVGGSRDVMIVLNGEIRPYVDATANYLQTRAHYPSVFDRNDSLELVDQLYTQLEAFLNELAQIRTAPKEFSFLSLRMESKGQSGVPALIRRIRYLHYALKFANTRLAEDGDRWPAVFDQTRQLYNGLIQVEHFLRGVRENLEHAQVDFELKMRLDRLMDDVRNQAVLIEKVHVSTEQRIRLANVRQDNVRTLLSVRLPLEAAMGESHVDLSPLEPPEFAANNGGGAAAPALPTPNALDKSIDAIIDLAGNTRSSRAKKDMLARFVEANAESFSIDQAIKVASCTWFDNITNDLLQLYVSQRAPFLSQDDFIKLGNAARDDASRKAIIERIPLPSRAGRSGGGVRI